MNPQKIYQFIRLFSLDIVAGGIASVFLSSGVMSVNLPWTYFTVLAITVWLIYIADHLLDGFKIGEKSTSASHRVFYKYKVPIFMIFLVMIIFDFQMIITRLDPEYIEFGIALGSATVFYLFLNSFYGRGPTIFFIKEVWITVIYSIAIWGGPIIAAGDKINIPQGFIMLSFTLLIFSNVLIFSFFESVPDTKDKIRSFASDFGHKLTRNLSRSSAAIAIILSVITFFNFEGFGMPVLVLVLIGTGYQIILATTVFFAQKGRYRILADLLLLLSFLTIIR